MKAAKSPQSPLCGVFQPCEYGNSCVAEIGNVLLSEVSFFFSKVFTDKSLVLIKVANRGSNSLGSFRVLEVHGQGYSVTVWGQRWGRGGPVLPRHCPGFGGCCFYHLC